MYLDTVSRSLAHAVQEGNSLLTVRVVHIACRGETACWVVGREKGYVDNLVRLDFPTICFARNSLLF